MGYESPEDETEDETAEGRIKRARVVSISRSVNLTTYTFIQDEEEIENEKENEEAQHLKRVRLVSTKFASPIEFS